MKTKQNGTLSAWPHKKIKFRSKNEKLQQTLRYYINLNNFTRTEFALHFIKYIIQELKEFFTVVFHLLIISSQLAFGYPWPTASNKVLIISKFLTYKLTNMDTEDLKNSPTILAFEPYFKNLNRLPTSTSNFRPLDLRKKKFFNFDYSLTVQTKRFHVTKADTTSFMNNVGVKLTYSSSPIVQHAPIIFKLPYTRTINSWRLCLLHTTHGVIPQGTIPNQ